MSFQIRDKNGEAIELHTLDKEIAALWGVPTAPEDWASPIKPKTVFANTREELDHIRNRMLLNWFDIIGRPIHQKKYNNWEDIRKEIISPYLGFLTLEEALKDDYIKPFLDVIKIWEEKGYIPVHIAD